MRSSLLLLSLIAVSAAQKFAIRSDFGASTQCSGDAANVFVYKTNECGTTGSTKSYPSAKFTCTSDGALLSSYNDTLCGGTAATVQYTASCTSSQKYACDNNFPTLGKNDTVKVTWKANSCLGGAKSIQVTRNGGCNNLPTGGGTCQTESSTSSTQESYYTIYCGNAFVPSTVGFGSAKTIVPFFSTIFAVIFLFF